MVLFYSKEITLIALLHIHSGRLWSFEEVQILKMTSSGKSGQDVSVCPAEAVISVECFLFLLNQKHVLVRVCVTIIKKLMVSVHVGFSFPPLSHFTVGSPFSLRRVLLTKHTVGQ